MSLRPRFSKPIDAPPTPMLPYADLCYQAALLAQMDKLERTEDPASLVSSVQLHWPWLRNQRLNSTIHLNFSFRLAISLRLAAGCCCVRPAGVVLLVGPEASFKFELCCPSISKLPIAKTLQNLRNLAKRKTYL